MVDGVVQGVRQLAARYEVGELIGRGGMADVHVGHDNRLGRRVAIKLLKPSLANDPAFRSRFRREAQDAAKMAHPTIVRIFDAGEETTRDSHGLEIVVPFIVMEFVDGRLLRDILDEGPFEPAEACRVIEQVLTALEYSHRAGVVHRDIKPGNIMITPSGQVKVMDFGIARAISDSSATIAETSAIVGTAQYFSPEQARGETVDARSDLYSTGVVLFELLTGRAPFRGENPVAVAYQHVNSEAVPPGSLNPKVSPSLDAVVLRALAKDRFDRYQSASEFRDDVETAAAGDIPVRKPLTATDGASSLFGVNPSSVAGSEATLRQLSVDQDDRTIRTQTRPPVAWIWAGIASMVVVVAAVIFWTFNLSPVSLAGAGVSVPVPNVIGQTYEDGAATLEDSNLIAQRFGVESTSVPVGEIISTDPEAGTTVAPDFQVRVNVSLGEATATVPDVSRMLESDAIASIQAKNLTWGSTTSDYSADLGAGVVIRSDPPGGSTEYNNAAIREGDTVNLVISNGLVNIPDVSGQPIAAANGTLSALLLSVRVSVDGSCSGGTVASQSVVGEAAQRSEVTLGYCSG